MLTLVARGLTNRAIGRQLAISEATVKTHLVHVFGKLGVADRTAAVTAALERGLIRLPAASRGRRQSRGKGNARMSASPGHHQPGRSVDGRLTVVSRPAEDGPWPGVVMLHEAFGIDDVMRRYAAKLAGLGYVVTMPDLLGEESVVALHPRRPSRRSRPAPASRSS